MDWYVNGARIQKPLGTKDWGVAQIRARQIEVEGLTTNIVPISIESGCDKFLADAKARQLRDSSIRKYRQLLNQLKQYAQTHQISLLNNLTTQHLLQFRAEWKNTNVSAKKKLELLKAFFRHCLDTKLLSSNPAATIKPPKVDRIQVFPFNESDMKRILKACDEHPTRPFQMRGIVLLMRHTGLRIGDACTLGRDRIQNNILMLRTHKSGTTVRLPLHRDLIKALNNIPDGKFFFWSGKSTRRTVVNIWEDSFKSMFKRAGINGHSHQLRHTFAVDMLLRGVSMEDLSTLLGHESIKTTERHYAAFTLSRQQALETRVREAWKAPTPALPNP